MMSKCKRNGCNEEGEDRAGYDGYCSLYCRDIADRDAEIQESNITLKALVKKCDEYEKAKEYNAELVRERDGQIAALHEAIKWVLQDMESKAPEQIQKASQAWWARLTNALKEKR